ncbi:MAG: hypothetical protein GOMPHAMPRED_008015 [Gomphillus americanus]|uniref:Nicotinate-nucleotide pyrophosphorylase [carboxylating] n=1 Tax=Gomphillus americanus TaxID=1940652 RepID=A0A8H3I3L6_9LECA|nr:MAG: hypothetical protein GOMPHAMPRED_008015 [Gomphillus americanus]
MAMQHGKCAHLLNPNFKDDVRRWLAEDCPSFDYGGFVVGEALTEAKLLGKSKGILAGVPFFDEVFHQLDCTVEWHFLEGSAITPIAHVATVRGPVRKILLGERVALNLLARCSGIATKTLATLELIKSHCPNPPILAGTRKTTPGFRLVEKYGMLVGGADAHRHDLSAMTMLKDNHVWACNGSITRAVHAAKAAGGFSVKVEVECQSEAEAREAVDAGADVVMLDNFSGEDAGVAAANLRDWYSGDKKREFLIEISGGLTEANIGQYANAGVDILSTSSIHQGVPHVDYSLKVLH